MSGLAIYMEGGGTGRDTKDALRRGMDAFLGELKDAARRKSWRWKRVCCGGRDEAFRAFRQARNNGDGTNVVLLVDAESPVNSSPSAHLSERDGWDLKRADDDVLHLMTQTMETWIVADPDNMAAYCKRGFDRNALPNADDLEAVAKSDISGALEKATRRTQKRKYHKIRHASELLKSINPEKARQRCSHCKRLFVVLGDVIANG